MNHRTTHRNLPIAVAATLLTMITAGCDDRATQIAIDAGMPDDHVFVLRDGAQWLTDGMEAWTEESIPVDEVLVDGRLIGEIGEIVMRDRRRIAQDGFIVALIPIDDQKRLVGEPQIVSRGFVYVNDAEDMMNSARREIKQQYRRGSRSVQRALEDYFYRETQLRPVVLPQYIQV